MTTTPTFIIPLLSKIFQILYYYSFIYFSVLIEIAPLTFFSTIIFTTTPTQSNHPTTVRIPPANIPGVVYLNSTECSPFSIDMATKPRFAL